MSKYVFTSDVDWAPEEVIEDTISLFAEHNAKITFFSTHRSEQLLRADRNFVEIGIHPNFNKLLFNNDLQKPDEIVRELLQIYPEAVGVRSHSLSQSSGLVNLFKASGLKYESNTLLPYFSSIVPYKCWTGLTRIPYNWEDDVHFTYGYDFSSDNLADDCDYKIYDFHPIHIYLNTDIEQTYLIAKPFINDIKILKTYINKSKFGTRDLLIQLLTNINKIKKETYFMSDLIIND